VRPGTICKAASPPAPLVEKHGTVPVSRTSILTPVASMMDLIFFAARPDEIADFGMRIFSLKRAGVGRNCGARLAQGLLIVSKSGAGFFAWARASRIMADGSARTLMSSAAP